MVTPQGLAVDALQEAHPPGSSSSDSSSDGGNASGAVAVFYICPADVSPGNWARVAQLGQAGGQDVGGADHTRALTPLLHGAMRHHIGLVQRAGYRIKLVPLLAPSPGS